MPEVSTQNDLLFSSAFLEQEGLTALAEAFKITEKYGRLDYLVALGAGMITEPNVVPKNISKMNILAATALSILGITNRIIVTGGKTKGEEYPSESQAMADYLASLIYPGNPVVPITLETTSKTTHQNALNILELLGDNLTEDKKLGIIGSNYHVNPRAKSIFNEVMGTRTQLLTAFNSDQILHDFLYLTSHHSERFKSIKPESAELIEKLSVEMHTVLEEFKKLPLWGDGGRASQILVALAFKLPKVRAYIESIGRQRGT